MFIALHLTNIVVIRLLNFTQKQGNSEEKSMPYGIDYYNIIKILVVSCKIYSQTVI